ncbi:MAG: hypothetical protein Q9220_005081 [cf. Caloplaca sp. 1 TL-2023]
MAAESTPSPQDPSIILALSGLSSTGKTTIASHLPSIFPPPQYTVTILHVDDFYKPQTELPHRAVLLDWDCVGSLDWPKLENAVRRWRDGGEGEVKEGSVNPQPEFGSSATADDDGDALPAEEGGHGITAALTAQLRDQVQAAAEEASGRRDHRRRRRRLLILDGFLLFTPSTPATFRSLLDLKMLLRAPYAAAKGRREARSGYDTMEGWWEDPPGYFDKVVWPNYVEENGCFFVGGDVEGRVDGGFCEREGVKVWQGKGEGGLGEVLRWVVREVGMAFEASGGLLGVGHG